ncbi:MAG: hypothetical protein QNJ13_16435 [Paracoccaceae bacterium]|nr:hypothetical protein [Paracoccaceae bacterium]
MTTNVPKVAALLTVFLAMAFALLLTVVMLERAVLPVVLGDAMAVAEEDIRATFSALKLLVGGLPYTLGVMIAGAIILAVTQAIASRGAVLPVAVLLILLAPVSYNIFLVDTALVVATLEARGPTTRSTRSRQALLPQCASTS